MARKARFHVHVFVGQHTSNPSAKRQTSMGSHPVNLAIRFLLELAALVAMGLWGRQRSEGVFRFLTALAVPIIAAAVWGTFAVPHDPSRSGSAPVAVSGALRLGIEAMFFAGGVGSLFATGSPTMGSVFAIADVIHYAASYDRVAWLLRA